MDPRVPVTLITGFLGSGKTTLVNRLLREDPEGFFVVVNEYGEVPLDHLLVEGRAEALAEGCACCASLEDLVAVLASLRRKGGVRHLLLETSGLAHPGPLLGVFLSPGVREAYRLAGVVTLVDPLHLGLYLSFPEAKAQVVYADLLLISKTDRASEEEVRAAEEALRRLNPLAPLRRLFRGEGLEAQEALFPRRAQGFRLVPPPVHAHREGLESVSLVREGEVDLEALKEFLEDMVFSRGPFRRGRAIRSKGEVNLKGSRHPLRFHGVYALLDFEKGPPWPPGPRLNRMVFIGEGLDREGIQEAFARMFP